MKNKIKIKQISFIAILIALSLVLSVFSKILKFSFLSFDFSLIFIFIIYFYLGLKGLLLGAFSRFFLSCIFLIHSGTISLVGQIILLIIHISFGFIYHFICYFWRSKKVLFIFLKLILVMILTTILISTFNTFASNIIYFNLFGTIKSLTLDELLFVYNDPEKQWIKLLFLGIDNYYLASYALYGAFNLINLSISILIIFQLLIIFKKTNLETYLNLQTNNFSNQW